MVARNSQQQERYRARWRKLGAPCALCGLRIDYDIKWPDPQSFVVDHIHPIAKGGAHTFANTQPAHADCNSRKRARVTSPVIRRSGSFD